MDDNYQNFKLETAYNSIQLVSHQGRLELRGRDKSLQSVINLEKPHQLELKNLEYLDVTGTRLTDQQVNELQQALPDCNIDR